MKLRSLRFLLICIVFLSCFFVTGVSGAASESFAGVDLMIVCAHPGDEYLYLGGALPIYAGEQGCSAVVVYLSCEDEAQKAAALKGLSRFGKNVQAVFGTFSSAYTATEEEALLYWDKREVAAYLVSMIQQYNPTVILTHDSLGEYGHGAHRLASDCTVSAVHTCVDNAAKAGASDSVALRFQRLFLHLYADHQVTLDRSVSLSHFDGETALALDQEGYQGYPVTYPIEISDETGYTCAQYGLAYAVDATTFDPAAGDLFAGLDASMLGPTSTPVPTPAETPEPTQSPAAAAQSSESDQLPAATDTENAAQASATPVDWERIAFIALAALALGALVWIFLSRKKEGAKRRWLIPCVVLLLAIAYAAYRIVTSVSSLTSFPAEKADAAVAVPTQTPAVSGTPAETAAPTPTPDPWDPYFRSASDPSEVVIVDPDNNHWEYRTDQLSIIINRIHVTRPDKKPLVYCVAEIRMRGEDAFRAGLRDTNTKATPRYEQPWAMARRYKAVLAITGDSLTHSEVELKGILIRNGNVYSENQAQDMLAFYPDDLTMKVYKPGTITAKELLDQGVINTYSFGPTLLNDGMRDLTSKRGNLGRLNPRCGIGMVEPGYFIAITVDGRQDKYSVGMTLDEFAQLFYSYGCKVAYNLDGGSSTVMVFMGEHLNQHAGVGSDVQRLLADALLWGESELVPTVDDPVYNNGNIPKN